MTNNAKIDIEKILSKGENEHYKNSVCANFAHTAADKAAISKANEEFDVYNKNQKIFSDFDKEIKKLK